MSLIRSRTYFLFSVRTLLELDLSEPVVHLPGEIPTNESCVLPAITQFPSPLGMDKSTRQHGAVIIHIVLAIYMFTGLAVVCDDFFVPALEKISEGQ